MKLLFDENLSHRLVEQVADVYPGSSHIREVGLLGATDARIWEYAAEHGFLVTSKDTDFYQRSLVFGAPPKVLWLRVGNAPTEASAALLREQSSSFGALQRTRRQRSSRFPLPNTRIWTPPARWGHR